MMGSSDAKLAAKDTDMAKHVFDVSQSVHDAEAAPQQDESADEARLYRSAERKALCCIMPFICLMCFINYLDRTNLSFASLTMNPQLGLSAAQYGLGSGMFFLGYAFFQVPSNMCLLKVGGPRWLAIIVVCWGVVAACMAAMTNVSSYLGIRLVLGICEAGAFPGFWYYLSTFFPEDRITVPYAIINITLVLTQVVGVPMAAGILTLDGAGRLYGWQWLFLIGGLAAVVIGYPVWFCLPMNIEKAKFLSLEEKRALLRANMTAAAQNHAVFDIHAMWPAFKGAIGSPVVLYGSFWRMFQNMGYYAIIHWAPLLVGQIVDSNQSTSSTHVAANVVLLVAVPFGAAAIFQAINSWHSQRTHERRWHIVVPWAVGGIMLCVLPSAMSHSPTAGLAVLAVAAMGVNSADGINVGWVGSLLHGPQRAMGLAVFDSISGLGGFVGPYIVGALYDRTGNYSASIWTLGAAMLVAALMVLCFNPRCASKGPVWALGRSTPTVELDENAGPKGEQV
eukprot:jgi/Chrzof1/12934/Cz07g13020.t1